MILVTAARAAIQGAKEDLQGPVCRHRMAPQVPAGPRKPRTRTLLIQPEWRANEERVILESEVFLAGRESLDSDVNRS